MESILLQNIVKVVIYMTVTQNNSPPKNGWSTKRDLIFVVFFCYLP